jgi:hypothetical protein
MSRPDDPLDKAFTAVLEIAGTYKEAADEEGVPADEINRILQRVTALRRRWRHDGLTRGAR